MVVLHLRLGCIVAKADDGLAAVVAVALRSVNSASYCPTTGLADYNAVAKYYNHSKTALYCIQHLCLGLPLEPPDYSAVINDFDHFIVRSNLCQCRSTSCCLHFTVIMDKSDEQKNTM